MKRKVLVVDDEPDVVALVRYNLEHAGYDVDAASDGAEGLLKARTFSPHLIVLDLMLPEISGLDVCKMLRYDQKTAAIPIIMLTAKVAEIDRVLGLELGADDYVTKPFSPRELVLRINKRLDLAARCTNTSHDIFDVGDLHLDVSRHLLSIKGKRVELTATEFSLFTELLRRRGHVLSRDKLLREVWEHDSDVDTRTVDTHMRRLREKLGSCSRYLDTVHGKGYRFLED